MIRYFRDLWSGRLPLSRVLWFDMLAVGTLVNVLSLVGMIAVLAAGAPTAAALVLFLAPIPYNVALFAGVWRSAEREGVGWAWLARSIASVWLVAAIVVV
jgi:hypothetical protein